MADRTLEDAFSTDGYCIVDVPVDLLDAFDELYRRTRPSVMSGFHATTQTDDPRLKPLIHDEVCRLAAAAAGRWFVGHRLVAGNFVVKQPGDYWVQPHQDLNFVDEERFRAAVVWVPLLDVDEENGALHAVPRSHRLPTVPRGSGDHVLPYAAVGDHLRAHRSVVVPLRRGQAVVYDARTFHWSAPNESSVERVAAAFAAIPADAPMLHYHLNPDRTVAVLDVDDAIYADTRFHGFPVRGTVVRVEDLPDLPPVDVAMVDHLLAAPGAAAWGTGPTRTSV